MSNLKANALRLVGSSDLIGNPTDFVNTLGTGVKSFYYEPRDGFMKGPLQGGIGLIKGTGSLAAHVVGGLAGSVSKVTNTLNKGLLQLSGDTEYIHKKEIKDIRHKPTGALDGSAPFGGQLQLPGPAIAYAHQSSCCCGAILLQAMP